MHHSGQRGDIARTVTGFLTNRDLGPTTQNQVTLNTLLRQGGQKPDPITGAGRPGHGDDDAHALKHYSWRSNSSVTDPPRTTVRTERCRPVAEPAQVARCCCGDIAASKPKQSIGTKVGTTHLTVVHAGCTTNICRRRQFATSFCGNVTLGRHRNAQTGESQPGSVCSATRLRAAPSRAHRSPIPAPESPIVAKPTCWRPSVQSTWTQA